MTVFDQTEIELMLDLEVQLFGTGRIAQKMCEYLPGKSNKEIRDRRCVDRYKTMRRDRLLRVGLNGPDSGDASGEVEDEPMRADFHTRSCGVSEFPRSV
jgi:hypothetical protein